MRERGHLKSLLLFLFLINITPPCFAAALKGPRPGAWIEILSWWPRAVLYHGFLSDEEADHVRKIAEPRLGRSGVLNYDGSRTPEDSIRTSYGTFLAPAEDDVIKAIDIRVATWTHLPPSHSESVQVLRYECTYVRLSVVVMYLIPERTQRNERRSRISSRREIY